MERRVKKSHPDYKGLNELASSIAALKNTAVHFNTNQAVESGELPNSERCAIIRTAEDKMADELDGGAFKDYLNDRKR